MFWKITKLNKKPDQWQLRLSERISKAVSKIQGQWASWMDKRINGLPVRGQKVALLTFCLAMLAFCSYSVTSTWVGSTTEMKPDTKITIPRRLNTTPQEPSLPAALVQRLMAFRKKIDSLAGTQAGIKIRDSLIKARPGLLDSLKAIEEQYQLPIENDSYENTTGK